MEKQREREKSRSTMTDEFLKAYKEDPYSEKTKSYAKELGYEVVIRQGKPYIRKMPDRFVGNAMLSAYNFGLVNHQNRDERGVVIKANGTIQNVVAVKSAQEIRGSKFTKKKSLKEKIEEEERIG